MRRTHCFLEEERRKKSLGAGWRGRAGRVPGGLGLGGTHSLERWLEAQSSPRGSFPWCAPVPPSAPLRRGEAGLDVQRQFTPLGRLWGRPRAQFDDSPSAFGSSHGNRLLWETWEVASQSFEVSHRVTLKSSPDPKRAICRCVYVYPARPLEVASETLTN